MARLTTIHDLLQDSANANKGTPRGTDALVRSIGAFGVGRPVVADKNGQLIAGNKTHEAAKKAGITKIRVVETAGDELIVHKRTDLDLDSPTDNRARGLAIADNRISLISQNVDMEIVKRQIEEHALELEPLGYKIEEIKVGGAEPSSPTEPAPPSEPAPTPSGSSMVGEHFGIYVECQTEGEQREVFDELIAAGRKARLLTL